RPWLVGDLHRLTGLGRLPRAGVVAELHDRCRIRLLDGGPVGEDSVPRDYCASLGSFFVIGSLLLCQLGNEEVVDVAGVLPTIGRSCIRGLERSLDTFLGCGVGGVGRGW